LDRITEREISASQLAQFADWLVSEPEVPEGRWFKRFPEMIVCGEGALIKTFLRPGQVPAGEEVTCSELRKFARARAASPSRRGDRSPGTERLTQPRVQR